MEKNQKDQKESLVGVRLHESLTWRMAAGMLCLFTLMMALSLGLTFFLRLNGEYQKCRQMAKDSLSKLIFGEENPEEMLPSGTVANISVKADKRSVYQIGSWNGNLPPTRYSVHKSEFGTEFFIKYKTDIQLFKTECLAEYVFDCSEFWKELKQDFFRLVAVELLLLAVGAVVIFFCIKAFLKPIWQMSQRVRTITANNLHKERLDVVGTQDELKALAMEINRMLDRMDRAYEAQKQFVSEASHELRTPITVLQGYSSMLRRWGADDKEVLAESIEAIESEAKSMQDLVEKLLFLSRHERRKLPFVKERFEISEILEELAKEMEYMTKGKRVLRTKLDTMTIYGDKQALKQAFRVFLDNAVKYSAEGDTISISCKNKTSACEIVIEDTGLGMRREDLEGIFTRFFRADTVRGKNIDGHGLGLSIARLIIDGHAGKIAVRTQYTKGTCFIVTIPWQRGN